MTQTYFELSFHVGPNMIENCIKTVVLPPNRSMGKCPEHKKVNGYVP